MGSATKFDPAWECARLLSTINVYIIRCSVGSHILEAAAYRVAPPGRNRPRVVRTGKWGGELERVQDLNLSATLLGHAPP